MVGRGDGLTPYDDDVLCGWLAVHRAAGVATDEVDAAVRGLPGPHHAALRDAARLRDARRGDPGVRRLARRGRHPAEPDRAAALARVGHTSGRGMLQGARAALSHFRPFEGAA